MKPLPFREFLTGFIQTGIKVTYQDQVITTDNIDQYSDEQLRHAEAHNVSLTKPYRLSDGWARRLKGAHHA